MNKLIFSIYRSLVIFTFLISFTFFFSQTAKTSLVDKIPEYDFAKLWKSDSINVALEGGKIPFPEPVGFIGENYQRFYIHYLKITKNSENPNEYIVTGKSKVKNFICSFTGTINVVDMYLFNEIEFPGYRQGEVVCNINFRENPQDPGSGYFTGKLTTSFYLDSQNNIFYDTFYLEADKFKNNICEAKWTSYKTGKSKICNWGDFGAPLPNGSDFDIGDGEIIINKKYLNNGWISFSELNSLDERKSQNAKKLEDENWWD